ncbi:unnamed protein product [Blepharisma stoltei]|uniref:Dickkopf N-terminal cysteine-rich domain-containing protein n=1 Tax=Blepharisma stoltei TaxID=1481888 RepID=A0AAU9JER4_9CILI|nr:unnamed protein product [Blepharisma stoltei]
MLFIKLKRIINNFSIIINMAGEIKFLSKLMILILFWNASADENTMMNCTAYTCKQKGQSFTSGTCVYYNSKAITPTYYVKPCSSSKEYCPIAVEANTSCTKIPDTPIEITGLYPGEKCTKDTECRTPSIESGKTGCVDNICTGQGETEGCESNPDCKPGLYCLSGTCQKQIAIGSYGCENDFQCANGAGCNITNEVEKNKCVAYRSIAAHQPVGECAADGTNALCASKYCQVTGQYQPTEGEYQNTYACLATVISNSYLPMKCSYDVDCRSVSDDFFTDGQVFGTCVCGHNKDAQSYCTLFPGDPIAEVAFGYFQKWLNGTDINYCNTEHRFNSYCMSNWWSKKNYEKYMFAAVFADSYPVVVDEDDCVAEVYDSVLYELSKELDSSAMNYVLLAPVLVLVMN